MTALLEPFDLGRLGLALRPLEAAGAREVSGDQSVEGDALGLGLLDEVGVEFGGEPDHELSAGSHCVGDTTCGTIAGSSKRPGATANRPGPANGSTPR